MGADESVRRYGRAFDHVSEAYDTVRPGYPDEVLDAALEAGGVRRGSQVVEVGCGTGKLTEGLVARGLRVVAVDPGPNMVARAQNRVGTRGAVEFHLTTFEDADLPEGAFEAVFSAAAFHWVDPSVGWRKAALLLRPGGLLALISHLTVIDERTAASEAALWEVLGVHAPEIRARFTEPRSAQALLDGALERATNVSDVWSWIASHDLSVPEVADLFDHVRVHGVPLFTEVTADDLVALFRTTSVWARLSTSRRNALEADDRRVIEEFGGTIGSSQLVVLVTARRRAS